MPGEGGSPDLKAFVELVDPLVPGKIGAPLETFAALIAYVSSLLFAHVGFHVQEVSGQLVRFVSAF